MTPVMALNNVVLPAPFGPMIARRWPRGTAEADAVDRTQRVEGDNHIGQGENVVGHESQITRTRRGTCRASDC